MSSSLSLTFLTLFSFVLNTSETFLQFNDLKSIFISNQESHQLNSVQTQEKATWSTTLINTMSFYGSWSTNDRLFENFEQSSGFIQVGQIGTDEVRDPLIWDLTMVLYDGKYIDQRYLEIEGVYNISTFDFNSQNSSFFAKDIMFHIESGINRQSISQAKCQGNMNVYFTNFKTGKSISEFKEDGLPTNIGVQFSISSSNCSISFQTEVLFSNYPISIKELVLYASTILVYITCGAYGCQSILRCYPRRSRKLLQISVWALFLLNYYDAYLMFFHLANAATLNGWFISVSFIIFGALMIPETSAVYAVNACQNQRRNNNDRLEMKYVAFYNIFLLCLIFGSAVYLKHQWVDLIGGLFMLPQIIHTFIEGRKASVPFKYIIFYSIARITITAYTLLSPGNVYKFSPDFEFFIIYSALLAVQFVILVIQNKYPRFFWQKKQFNYEVTLGTAEEKQEVCPICMEALVEEIENKRTLIEENKKSDVFETPCKHRFHGKCLKDWMKRKFECPFCKRGLPIVSLDQSKIVVSESDLSSYESF